MIDCNREEGAKELDELKRSLLKLNVEQFKGNFNENLEESKQGLKRRYAESYLFLSAFLVDLNLFTAGCSMVWTSPILSRLKSNDINLNPLGYAISPYEESLIAGMFALGLIVGPMISSRTADCYGRKPVVISLGVVQLLSYIVLAIAKNVYLYYLVRFMLGISMGAAVTVLTVYTSEITEKHNRGKYASMIGVFPPLGNLYGYLMGPFFSIPTFSFICAVPSLFYVPLSMFIITESPVHHITKGSTNQAVCALKKIRNKLDVIQDFKEIQLTIKNNAQIVKFKWDMFQNAVLRRSFIIAVGLSLLQALSGVMIIMAFLGPIFDSAEVQLSGNSIAIILGLVKVFTFMFTSAVVEKSGRRPLLLISTVFTSISHFLLGVFFYLKNKNSAYLSVLSWLPMLCVLTFIVSYSLGIGSAIWIYLGEVFPSNIKSTAVSLSHLSFFITSAVATFCFPILVSYFGIPVCFWIFSLCCMVGIIFVYFFVPETKGKSLLEIQKMLEGPNYEL